METGNQTAPAPAPFPDYDRMWEEVYGDWPSVGPSQLHTRRIMRDLFAGIDYRTAIDVGCGAGHNLSLLAEHGERPALTGVDLSAVALERARQRFPGGSFHQLDIERGHLDRSFDLVFSAYMLEHVADDEAALANMRPMAKKHLLVATVAGDFERWRPWEDQVGHMRNYRRGELEEKLRQAGFEPRTVIYWGFPMYSPLTRLVMNRVTLKSDQNVALVKLAARVLYVLYFLNSRRRGDVVIIHAVAA